MRKTGHVLGLMNDDGWEAEKDFIGETDGSSGRWPSNIILSHDERCKFLGMKRVSPGKGFV